MDGALAHFLQGILIGFAIAAPVGPVGILCIRRALADGHAAAFVAGLGAAVADTFYGAVAAFGIRFVSDFLEAHQTALKLVGGLFILGMGLHTWRSMIVIEDTPKAGPGLLRDFASTCLVTLTNPGTILAFMGVFAALGPLSVEDWGGSATVVAGVFVGSALWWLTLSGVVDRLRSRFSPQILVWINHASGAALLLFGAAILLSVGV